MCGYVWLCVALGLFVFGFGKPRTVLGLPTASWAASRASIFMMSCMAVSASGKTLPNPSKLTLRVMRVCLSCGFPAWPTSNVYQAAELL